MCPCSALPYVMEHVASDSAQRLAQRVLKYSGERAGNTYPVLVIRKGRDGPLRLTLS